MQGMELLLQKDTEDQAESIIRQPRGSQLIYGPTHVGKATLAAEIARRLNCEGCSDGSCRNCKMAKAGNHPDILKVSPDEKGKIGIEAVQGLQKSLSLAKYQKEGTRVAIIEDAHTMTIPAQNSLLKVLEEPPANTLIILTATDKTSLLITILSRCQTVFMAPQSTEAVSSYLQTNLKVAKDKADAISRLAEGAVGIALQYAETPALLEERQKLESAADSLMKPNLFNRLLSASELSSAKADSGALTVILSNRLKNLLKDGQAQDAADSLEAVQRFRERLSSNVNLKTAYEALALELQC